MRHDWTVRRTAAAAVSFAAAASVLNGGTKEKLARDFANPYAHPNRDGIFVFGQRLALRAHLNSLR